MTAISDEVWNTALEVTARKFLARTDEEPGANGAISPFSDPAIRARFEEEGRRPIKPNGRKAISKRELKLAIQPRDNLLAT